MQSAGWFRITNRLLPSLHPLQVALNSARRAQRASLKVKQAAVQLAAESLCFIYI